MRRVRYALQAAAKIRSLCDYYAAVDDHLRARAMNVIVTSLNALASNPAMGRPYAANADYREKVIAFGSSHFIALYRIDGDDNVIVTAIRHERESGYGEDGL